MVIIGDQEGEYPRLDACLRQLETLAERQPATFATIIDFVTLAGQLDGGDAQERRRLETQLKRALAAGEPPVVTIMDAPGACSQYLRGSNTIVLERSLARRFEASGDDPVCGRFLRREVTERLLQALSQWLLARCLPHVSGPVLAHLALDRLRDKPCCDC